MTRRTPSPKSSKPRGQIFIGCAGWTIPRDQSHHFAEAGSHLLRYAQVFPAVEINSSFYRPHRLSTYIRWAETVGPDFRFAVKLAKKITHELRLVNVEMELKLFVEGCTGLYDKWGCLLVQLPPSLKFDAATAIPFFEALGSLITVDIACEPRHASWFTPDVDQVLTTFRIARVAADPVLAPHGAEPGGWNGATYFRLHGSPRVYYSSYDDQFLTALAQQLEHHQSSGRDCWCIFDNTAAGAAVVNAITLLQKLKLSKPLSNTGTEIA